MSSEEHDVVRGGMRWKTVTAVTLAALAAVTAAAFATRVWVLTAIPVGFLFGFFLQKGDLCGASAFSEVILFRQGGKVFGLWVAIVVSMLAFAAGDRLGLIALNPKPMFWWNYILGGAVFGVGTVLAGGCVSGCLYKGAAGNINSIAALVAMPFGIGLVEYGPLAGWFRKLASIRTDAADGGAIDLPALTGLPFWAWALILAAATAAGVAVGRKKARRSGRGPDEVPRVRRLLTRPWKPWQAGLAIGLIALFAYMSSAATGRNYPLGVTHGVLHAGVLLTESPVEHVYKKPDGVPSGGPGTPAAAPRKKVVWWLVLLVGSLMAGSHVSARLSGQARLLPKPPEQTLVAIAGGFLVGAGAAFASGCVIGNILSGWALLSMGALLFGVTVILANWATTYVYLLGGR